MENILEQIVANKKLEVQKLKENFSYRDFEKSQFFDLKINSFVEQFQQKQFGIIAEIKRKSPSAGILSSDLNPVEFAQKYKDNGMAGISILTDKDYFGGSNSDLSLVKENVLIPILRKEFIVDEIQIIESKAIGADAILLIAEVLTKQQVKEFTIIAKSLGLEVIMELHDFQELDKIYAEVDILGVNNRNLKLQKTDIGTSIRLAPYLPQDKIKISESGIKSSLELKELAALNYKGALIGESILKSENVSSFLSQLNHLGHEI